MSPLKPSQSETIWLIFIMLQPIKTIYLNIFHKPLAHTKFLRQKNIFNVNKKKVSKIAQKQHIFFATVNNEDFKQSKFI